MHPIINWNELWKVYHASSPSTAKRDRDPGAVWDKRASTYARMTDDAHKVAAREAGMMGLHPSDTVLDVGAGNGRLTVPIAAKVAHVTALDASGAMLGLLSENMHRAGQSNFSVIMKRWEDVVPLKDVTPHDVVIDSFTLGFYDLQEALHKMEDLAVRTVYLFWHTGEWRSGEEVELYRTVFGDEAGRQWGYPDYLHVLNILHDMGIYASAQVYTASWKTHYASPEEAAVHWMRMHEAHEKYIFEVKEHFSRVLEPVTTGGFSHTVTRRQAMIWWTKKE